MSNFNKDFDKKSRQFNKMFLGSLFLQSCFSAIAVLILGAFAIVGLMILAQIFGG